MDAKRASVVQSSVLVVSLARPDRLRLCLQGILDQTSPPDEILVGLRPHDSESHAVASSFRGAVTVVPVYEAGQVAALNTVVAASSGEFVAIVDDDAVPSAYWLANIERWFASSPDVGGVGGRDTVHHPDHGGIDGGRTEVVGRLSWWGRLRGGHHLEAKVQDVDFLKGANMAYRRVAIGSFDDRLRGSGAQVCNDLDVSLSVSRAGWRLVYDPAVGVDHFPAPRVNDDRRDAPSLSALSDAQHNELYVLLKHQRNWARVATLLVALLIGNRRAPGPVLYAALVAKGRAPGDSSWASVWAVTRARLGAVHTWATAVRLTGRPGSPVSGPAP